MPKIKKLNAIQAWMHTQAGQTFLNYAYSWGASIVILGALFKLTHIDGADLMLFIGMGTEVIVFFLSGFDTPQVEEEGAEGHLSKAVDTDEAGSDAEQAALSGPTIIGGGGLGGGTIIIGGGGVSAPGGEQVTPAGVAPTIIPSAGAPISFDSVPSTGQPAPAMSGNVGEAAAALADNLSHVTIPNIPGMPPAMQEATEAYVNQLNELTDTLKKVAEQSARLTRDSEEMETMNRTLTGINRFYEMQLRSVGQQSATIDDVNTQTKRLAEQLEELNGVYARMVEALKMKVG